MASSKELRVHKPINLLQWSTKLSPSSPTETTFILLKNNIGEGRSRSFSHGMKCLSLQQEKSHVVTFSKTYQRICNYYSQILESRVGAWITCGPLQLSEIWYLLRGLCILMVLEFTFPTFHLPETHLFLTITNMPFSAITNMSFYKQYGTSWKTGSDLTRLN